MAYPCLPLIRHGVAAVAVAALLVGSPTAQQKNDAPAQAERPLDRNSYRLKVEPILESNGEVVIYRVQIWTLRKAEIFLHLHAASITEEGLLRREKEGGAYRAEFVLLGLLRDAEKAKRLGKNADFEFRSMTVGARGMTVITDEVDASTELTTILELSSTEGVYNHGARARIGRFRGKSIEVEAK
jgi:hypothetical protein